MSPSEFISEYVDPAVALWRADTNSKVLAMCAVSQIDILAEVVFNHLKGTAQAPAKRASDYRIALAGTAPAIGWANDAHDAHKHGSLKVQTRQFASGLVQVPTAGDAFFVDYSFCDDGVLGETDTSLVLNDGDVVSIADIVEGARAAWDVEFAARGLPPWPKAVPDADTNETGEGEHGMPAGPAKGGLNVG